MKTNPHLSPLQLDALALDALDHHAAAHVREHLASCAACRDTQEAAAELRDQFATSVLPRGLPAPRPRPGRWYWLAVPGFAGLLAMLAMWWHRPPDPTEPPELAIKGGASWQVFAKRDGQTFAVQEGTELAAGDRIRFGVLPDGARYLLVASVDGSGAVTIYHPYGGEQSAPVPADRFELAGSIVLDAAPGPERIYAILSDHPIAAELVRAQLRVVAAGGSDAIRRTRALQLPARAQLSLVFEKTRP